MNSLTILAWNNNGLKNDDDDVWAKYMQLIDQGMIFPNVHIHSDLLVLDVDMNPKTMVFFTTTYTEPI